MPQIIKVTLTAGVLEVDQTGKGHVIDTPSPHTQDVVWILSAPGYGKAEFEPIGGAAGGFAWISTPPPGLFADPVRFPPNRLRMEVLYVQQKADCWVYLLRVRADGNLYSTSVTTSTCPGTAVSAMVVKDPVIINR